MYRLATHFTVALLASAPAIAAEPPAVNFDYRQFVIESVVAQEPRFANPQKLIQGTAAHNVAEMAAVEAQLYRWTGEKQHAADALRLLAAVIDDWETTTESGKKRYRLYGDFFLGFPLAEAYLQLSECDQAPRLAPMEARFKALLRAVCYPLQRGDHNQAMCRALGTCLALQLFPDLDADDKWSAYVNDVWNDWYELRDTTENAPNYNAIFLAAMLRLAELTEREELLRDDRVRRMFERFRDQVSPSGHFPAYGDDGERGAFRGLSAWPAVFERAARLYSDPTFCYTARRVLAAERTVDRPTVHSAQPLLLLSYADRWSDPELKPLAFLPETGVLTRRTPNDPRAPDKLILSCPSSPAKPFVMVDLFARGHHAHPEQAGAMVWYESGGTIFIQALGYHNRAAYEASTFVVQPTEENFPYGPQPHPGIWQSADLPTARLEPISDTAEGSYKRRLTSINYRISHETGATIEFFLDYVRLTGPGGEMVIDDFEAPTPPPKKGEWIDYDVPHGQQALKLTVPPGTSFNLPHGIELAKPIEFDIREYPKLEFAWKVSRNTVLPKNGKILIFRAGPAEYDMVVGLRPFAATLQSTCTESKEGDQFGEATYGDFMTTGMSWTRRLILIREGPLVVVDTVGRLLLRESGTPIRIAAPRAGGTVWQLLAKDPPARGIEWLDFTEFWDSRVGQPSDRQRLLLWLAARSGEAMGPRHDVLELWNRTRPQVVSIRQGPSLSGTIPIVSVLMPHVPQSSLAELNSMIALGSEGEISAKLRLPNGLVRIHIDYKGTWSVIRE